ncbi:MAG: PQQ-binding-like beta-propeller repeat protein, partial [Candidatus Limnocylindrales bacterium]|nr:PQQ-binding-like beta-propeller repeat protein [Candidatus Limnocylindrales bacterium]
LDTASHQAGMKRARRLAGVAIGLCLVVAGCGPVPSSTSAPVTTGPAAPSPIEAGASPKAAPHLATTAPTMAVDWPVYHGNDTRTGVASGFPALRGGLVQAWSATLDGAVYGEPLGVSGRVMVATENDSVYSIDPANGRVAWRRHLGTPVPLSSLPCGNIDPLGITSTPVYDRASGSLFVVAELAGPHHVLFALDASTGVVRWSRSVDLPGDSPLAHQQRAALALGNGYVYVGFGGLAGDCGAYRGKVVGVPVSGHGATIAYRVPVAREGAVWATGGPVLDTHGNLYVSVGNGSSTTTYDGSDSVLELSPTLKLRSRFAPSQWAQDNASDADLGSLSPVLVPGGWVFIAGKSGIGYVLRAGSLGGIGGQVSSRLVCAAFGGAAQSGSTIYVPCSDGLRMIQIGSSGSIRLGWKAQAGANGPPVIGGGAIWSLALGSGELQALSPLTGAVLAQIAVGPVPHFASPTLWDGLVLVGTMHGVTAIRAGN